MTIFTADDAAFFILVLARVGGTLSVAPVFGSRVVPPGVKAALALALAVVFVPIVPRPAPSPSGLELLPSAAGEAAVGLAMGFAASLLFAGVQMGGAIVDQELGLSLASALDPAGGEPVALVAQFKLLMAGAAYVLVDGHHLLLSALADSYRAVPLRGLAFPAGADAAVAAIGAGLFAGAVKVAAPALVAVFAATLALALVARAMPAMGAVVSALPARLAIGLAVLAAATGAFVSGFAASVREGDDLVRTVLSVMGGRP